MLLSDQLTIYRLAEPDVEQTPICVFAKKQTPEIVWHFTERTPEQQFEYLRKMEIVSQQIADRVFYTRVGFWCRQCDFLPVRTGNERTTKETLVKIAEVLFHEPTESVGLIFLWTHSCSASFVTNGVVLLMFRLLVGIHYAGKHD